MHKVGPWIAGILTGAVGVILTPALLIYFLIRPSAAATLTDPGKFETKN
jgi:hypothetical protein